MAFFPVVLRVVIVGKKDEYKAVLLLVVVLYIYI